MYLKTLRKRDYLSTKKWFEITKAATRANKAPIIAEPKNTTRKRPTPLDIASLPVVWADVSDSSRAVVANTIAIASFKILSPKTNIFNTGSISSAWKIANVATGSTKINF